MENPNCSNRQPKADLAADLTEIGIIEETAADLTEIIEEMATAAETVAIETAIEVGILVETEDATQAAAATEIEAAATEVATLEEMIETKAAAIKIVILAAATEIEGSNNQLFIKKIKRGYSERNSLFVFLYKNDVF